MTVLLMIHAAVTWFMIGVVTYVQFVHYPMFRHWPHGGFGTIEREHQRRTSRVVMLPMLIELGTGAAMVAVTRNPWIDASMGLLILVWLITFFKMVKLHECLANQGFCEDVHQGLLRWNLARTFVWITRGICVLM